MPQKKNTGGERRDNQNLTSRRLTRVANNLVFAERGVSFWLSGNLIDTPAIVSVNKTTTHAAADNR
jgi:hypothetical protein